MLRRNSGFTLIELMIVVALIATIAVIAVPSLLGSVRASNEASAISSLRTMATVNEQYALRFGNFASTLLNLSQAGYIDEVLGSGTKSGFIFTYTTSSSDWNCTADPEAPNVTGDRFFYVDQSGVIRVSLTTTATSSDAPID